MPALDPNIPLPITPETDALLADGKIQPNPFAIIRGARKLSKDEAWTMARRREQEATFKWSHWDDPCIVVNMNPFPLFVNGGHLFGKQIPACPADKPFVYAVLDEVKWSLQDQGAGLDNVPHFYPWPVFPGAQACEYIRAYTVEQEAGGVLAFYGRGIPENLDIDVEIPIMRTGDDTDAKQYIERARANLKVVWDNAKERRDVSLFRRMQRAISNYENDNTRHLLDDVDRNDAYMAKAIGLIADLPRYCMITTLQDSEKKEKTCLGCGMVSPASAAICRHCAQYVFDVVGAYKAGIIEFGHMSMDRASDEEMAVILEEKERRDAMKHKMHAPKKDKQNKD